MKRILKSTVVVAGLCFTLGETLSWGGPPNNDVSDAQGNTTSGTGALQNNTTGLANTASGTGALQTNTEGWSNTASGTYALYSNTTGSGNTAAGAFALGSNTTGSDNLAIGIWAGADLVAGSNNIYLGNKGIDLDSNTMRLGQTQTSTYIAGIFDSTVGGGSHVVINSQGQLGTLVSSARYKRDIRVMGDHSQKLQRLRPVTFRYKGDQEGQLQYGLIAEEVAKVYPELVVRGAKGKIESVQYHQLIPLLLNETQHQQQKLEAQGQRLAELKAQNARLQATLVQQHLALAARLEQLEQGARPLTTVSTR